MNNNPINQTEKNTIERFYHIVSIRMDNESETLLTRHPMTHEQCCNNMQRFTKHPFRRIQLKEVTQ